MPLTRSFVALAVVSMLAAPVAAQTEERSNPGAYLAARHAAAFSDFAAGARYFGEAVIADPENETLLEGLIAAHVGQGQVERAVAVAERLREVEPGNQSANLVLLGQLARNGDWDRVLSDLEDGRSAGPLFDGLLAAWAHAGQGDMTAALEAFDAAAEATGVTSFALYHKSLALAQAGDFEGAAEILSGDSGETLNLDRRGVIAYAEVLSHLDRNDDALSLIDEAFGANLDPALADLRARLEAGETIAFDAVPSPEAGVAEMYYSIGSALSREAAPAYTLLYARMAQYLRPDHVDAVLLSAAILERMENYDLATEAYASVPQDDPSFHAAELGRAEALRAAGDVAGSIEVLRALAESHDELTSVHVALADALRQDEQFGAAEAAYDAAIERIDTPDTSDWIVFFARGITHERTDDWAGAESDFRRALELNPGQPQVLNYLGYSMVEKRENLDEALGLIEDAVDAEPESGHIIDSLGWALYRLGRFEEAVEPMERAVELMPVDAVVNDHLGDVYWSVGRGREAAFQWRRALSLATDESTESSGDVDPDRIRRKLEVGLDVVVAEEEGAANVAGNGG